MDLRGKTISILGDSISTFEGYNPEGFAVFYEGERCERTGVLHPSQTWWSLVAQHFGARVLANGSYSGSLVEGGFFPAGDSEPRAAALAGPAGEAPDVVLCFIGINDYGWGGARMNADGHGSATPPELSAAAPAQPIVAGFANPDQAQRFEASYASMLRRIRARFPQAEIWCVTLLPGRTQGRDAAEFAYDFRGVPFAAFNDAIRSAARAAGAHVADAAACGMDYESIEGTHPTAQGMRQIAAMVVYAMEHEQAIAEALTAQAEGPMGNRPVAFEALPSDLLLEWGAPELWRSHVLCPDKPCTFCSNATSPHNNWLLTCNRPSGVAKV